MFTVTFSTSDIEIITCVKLKYYIPQNTTSINGVKFYLLYNYIYTDNVCFYVDRAPKTPSYSARYVFWTTVYCRLPLLAFTGTFNGTFCLYFDIYKFI